MSWWKKILICTGVVTGIFLIILFIFYAIVVNYEIPTMEVGQYDLVKITQTVDGAEVDYQTFAAGEYYVITNDELAIESHSQDKGIAENEIGYEYFLHSNELLIFLPTEEAEIMYIGYYYEETKQIKILITEGEITYNYYYNFVE